MDLYKIVWSGSGLASVNWRDYGIEKKNFSVGIAGLKIAIGDSLDMPGEITPGILP